MGRAKKSYSINVHYPENEESMLCLRRNMAKAYMMFVKGYITTLPVCDEQKE